MLGAWSLNAEEQQDNLNEEEVNEQLSELGFTGEQIDQLNPTTKQQIANNEDAEELLYFDSAAVSFDENDGDMSTQALVDDMTTNVMVISLGQYNDSPYVQVIGDYDWKSMPFWTLSDAVALSWSDGWRAINYDHTYEHQYCQGCGEPGPENYYWDSVTQNYPSEESKLRGVGYVYDIKGGARDVRGTINAYLNVNDSEAIQSANWSEFKMAYAHDTNNPNVGISFPTPGGVGVSAGISFSGINGSNTVEDTGSYHKDDLSW
ncbi:hypothetical protein [Alkalibacillus flavidus]